MRRFLNGIHALLIAIDQLGWTLIGVLLYWLHLMSVPPNPDETISSAVGRGVIAGKWWGYPTSIIIDALFYFPEGRWNHCVRHIEKDEQ